MQQPAKPPTLALDASAWCAGFDAGRRGAPLSACSYPNTSDKALAWSSGYIEGKAARLRLSPLR